MLPCGVDNDKPVKRHGNIKDGLHVSAHPLVEKTILTQNGGLKLPAKLCAGGFVGKVKVHRDIMMGVEENSHEHFVEKVMGNERDLG